MSGILFSYFHFEGVELASLPYVNERVISKINQDYETVDGLWSDCLNKSFDFLVSDFEARQKKVTFGHNLFHSIVGGSVKNSVAADNDLHGFIISLQAKGYYTINLNNIEGDFETLKVIVDGNETEYTISECKGKGIELDAFNCSEIFVGFENSEGYNTRKECDTCGCNINCMSSFNVVSQKQDGTKIDPPFTFSLNVYSDIRPYILNQYKSLKLPLLYRAGMYLFQYAQTVNRVNVEGQAFRHEDVFEYYETEYNKYLNLAVEKFNPPKEGTKTKTAIQYISITP